MPKPKLSDDETFLKLFSACLSGVASQLEQMHSLEGLPPQDVFGDNLRNRESFAVKRAFRLACLAREELEIAQFNQEIAAAAAKL